MCKIINVCNNEYSFSATKNTVSVFTGKKIWKLDCEFRPYIKIKISQDDYKVIYFDEANVSKAEYFSTGVAFGIKSYYDCWKIDDIDYNIELETIIWVNKVNGRVYFELIPIKEESEITMVVWPSPWNWERKDEKSYCLFPLLQGMMIPSNWDTEITGLGYTHFCESGAVMPWFARVDNSNGLLTIIETPWDCDYHYHHYAEKYPTEMYSIWAQSLGKIRYRRIIRNEFINDCDYNKVCKVYRQYVKENGKLFTLRQKCLSNEKIKELIGSPVIHSYIYYYVKPEALIYNKKDNTKNYKFATFKQRASEIKDLYKKGLKKGYLHLDGWGVDGYDQQHPEILPPCEKAGGFKDMKLLADTCKESNILFALHDQYRDYYVDGKTYDTNNSVMATDGTLPRECTWNGGEQTYLCQALAGYYIEKNYKGLESLGIKPDGVYLDVYACTHPDQCANPEHTVTNKESIEYRQKCMSLLSARDIIISSESAVDDYIPYMVLCHHTPYCALYQEQIGDKSYGVPVPLVNLVYHDCFIIPWTMEENEDRINKYRYLNAILNGGPAYLPIDASEDEINKIDVISKLQEKLAFEEMISHEFLDSTYSVCRTVFSDGTSITVNFVENTYNISE